MGHPSVTATPIYTRAHTRTAYIRTRTAFPTAPSRPPCTSARGQECQWPHRFLRRRQRSGAALDEKYHFALDNSRSVQWCTIVQRPVVPVVHYCRAALPAPRFPAADWPDGRGSVQGATARGARTAQCRVRVQHRTPSTRPTAQRSAARRSGGKSPRLVQSDA